MLADNNVKLKIAQCQTPATRGSRPGGLQEITCWKESIVYLIN